MLSKHGLISATEVGSMDLPSGLCRQDVSAACTANLAPVAGMFPLSCSRTAQVSAPRRGLVDTADPAAGRLTLRPPPQATAHPLQQQWEELHRQREAAGADPEDDDEEPGASDGFGAGSG